MATARRKTTGTPDGDAGETAALPWTGALRFDVYEENSGRHRWRLTTSAGLELATSSESYASGEDAERAVGQARRGTAAPA
jgi:uncharacterized protein YegP (UPF0339 family)